MHNIIAASLIASAIMTGLNGCSKPTTYAADVELILKENCGRCHTGHQLGVIASGFSLDSYETIIQGSKRGPILVAGSSASSTLYQMVSGQTDTSSSSHLGILPLSTTQSEVIRSWIDQGAVKQ